MFDIHDLVPVLARFPVPAAVEAGQRIAVVDVGGGSTEIIVGEAGGSAESVKAHSFDIGCRRVT
ncbi:MAG: hypothetical protein IKO93_13485, partial [Lentisphaeria bacterium]|nr:hypothetical protein [Lentisphaeria bacterium]